MPISVRMRAGVMLSAIVCAAGFAAGPSRTAHASPAYGSGFIAYGPNTGTGASAGWTVVDVATRETHTITPTGGGFNGVVENLRYSPDGRRVAFVSGGPWVASADGTQAHLVAGGTQAHLVANGDSEGIAWSPDGSRILFGAQGIQSVPADGSGPPILAVPDPCGTSPQTTTRGYIFYTRQCTPAQTPSLAVYRPGDAAPTIVSNTVGTVSPDGSHVARFTRSGAADWPITVGEVGGNDAGRQVATIKSLYVSTMAAGPSGGLAVAHEACGIGPYCYDIAIVGDPSISTPEDIGGGAGAAPGFVTWANGPSNLPARPVADRIGGTDRIATAISASQWAFDAYGTGGRQGTVAVLARDDLYPDALAGTPLAVQMGGPLLLTPANALDPGVAAELRRVLAPDSTVYLLGGPAALGSGVVDTVRELGFYPVRLGGTDRYATAVAIATAISGAHPKSVLLATGTNFPDALTAGAAASQERYSLRGTDAPGGGVVLLTDGATMPAATLAYLGSLKPGTAPLYAVGGPAAAAMHSAAGWWPTRIPLVGSDRYDTAAKVATSALYGYGAPGRYTMAAITTGLNFPDAMSGGALAGSQGAPLLLTDRNGLNPAENVILRAGNLSDIAVVGGPGAVSNGVFATSADTAFGRHNWDTATNRTAPPLR